MDASTSKVTIHMVSSLDGYIAKSDGSVSWLKSKDHYEQGVTLSEEYINKILEGIDCYILGSKTYEHALKLGWPYGDTPVIVLTHRGLSSDNKYIEFYKGDLEVLLNEHLKPIYKSIWIAGGASIVREFIRLNLADEIIISIMPVILGEGLLFFDSVGIEQDLHLKDVTAFKDGMVELSYEIKKHSKNS